MQSYLVTSLAEVWIEIADTVSNLFQQYVTSLAEVWIEISKGCPHFYDVVVTSLAEVWIEMITNHRLCMTSWSLPLRKCGLKFLKY